MIIIRRGKFIKSELKIKEFIANYKINKKRNYTIF